MVGASDGLAAQQLDTLPEADQQVEDLRKQLEAATAKLKRVEKKPDAAAATDHSALQPPAPEPAVTAVQAPEPTEAATY